MPKAEAVLWSSAIGLIAVLGVIIAWLINKGFDALRASIEREFQALWEKFTKFQDAYQATAASLQAHKEAEAERQKACEERHRRIDTELQRLSEQKE